MQEIWIIYIFFLLVHTAVYMYTVNKYCAGDELLCLFYWDILWV